MNKSTEIVTTQRFAHLCGFALRTIEDGPLSGRLIYRSCLRLDNMLTTRLSLDISLVLEMTEAARARRA